MFNRARTPAQRRTADGGLNGLANGNSTPRRPRHHHSSHGDDVSAGAHHPSFVIDGEDLCAVTAHSSLLQPRVAVLLGLPKTWHPLLFVCRLLSIVPAVWWGLPCCLRLLAMLHLLFTDRDGFKSTRSNNNTPEPSTFSVAGTLDMSFEARLRLLETVLATIWCGASGYLSFFFTDCLMSRWLLNYTPQATLVRLLAISATNAYLTSCALWVTGGSADPRLLLPAWIGIASALTLMYHVTQSKVSIRKETRMSISVFSLASFISMAALLAQLHSNRSDYQDIPLVAAARQAWQEALRVAFTIMQNGNAHDIL
ncbi:hypothetical protein OQA88_7341 [Cercophora sp. LCS_1]